MRHVLSAGSPARRSLSILRQRLRMRLCLLQLHLRCRLTRPHAIGPQATSHPAASPDHAMPAGFAPNRAQAIAAGAHGLNRPLVVSLTSYPPRFPTLALTLKSLLLQETRPDALILWIAREDMAALPKNIRRLERYGLVIAACPDLKSYKKLIPALAHHPESFIVTADDDTYYWGDWLSELARNVRPEAMEVLFHRGHAITFKADGSPAEYKNWTMDIDESGPSRTLFPTGLGGILYPPDVFPETVSDAAGFMSLCPSADDVWFYWMAALNGAEFRKIGARKHFVEWRGSQRVSLYSLNVIGQGANDSQIAQMVARYGFPVSYAAPLTMTEHTPIPAP